MLEWIVNYEIAVNGRMERRTVSSGVFDMN